MQSTQGRSHRARLQVIHNAADGKFRLARSVKINENQSTIILLPYLVFGLAASDV